MNGPTGILLSARAANSNPASGTFRMSLAPRTPEIHRTRPAPQSQRGGNVAVKGVLLLDLFIESAQRGASDIRKVPLAGLEFAARIHHQARMHGRTRELPLQATLEPNKDLGMGIRAARPSPTPDRAGTQPFTRTNLTARSARDTDSRVAAPNANAKREAPVGIRHT